ncbi:MAG: hypothetical protein JXA01_01135 [Dehalococcoidia bacterium]|nr:hypothetical protein [Dehalococcoidia bacterium]
MAGKSFSMSNTAKAILAIVVGVLILINWLPLYLVMGLFLIVWGILELINK